MTDELFIWIPRWDEFQVYHKKRDKTWAPPWIRVYTRLLDDYNYLGLTPRQRGLLHDLWLLFAKTRLELGLSPARIGRMLGDSSVRMRDFESLRDAGFVEFCSRTVLEQRRNAFWNGSSLEVEVEKEQPVPVPVPVPNYAGTGTGTADEDIPPATPTEPNGAGAEERWKTAQDIQTLDPTTILRGVA